ncbi:MAG: aminopeptidase P family protein [Limisphaerales bacterium]|jgi:Xaa-Pro aminopeptidase
MRYTPINPTFFIENRRRLAGFMERNSLAVLNANDIMPTNADGTMPLKPNSDLFYLTGIEQEETIFLFYPDAFDKEFREVLFLRETNPTIEIWEGHKLTKEEARKISGVQNVQWLSEFPKIFHRLMCECDNVYLNTNEHKRAVIEVQTRDARFIEECRKKYPLHNYLRLARLMHRLRAVKSPVEIELIKKACKLTESGFLRVLKFVKPGINEMEVEAEFAHEFIRNGGYFAYQPIIASGLNSCVLHYVKNDKVCKTGEVLLLDVAAGYANFNSDLTRTIPVSGKFSARQKKVYNAVLRVFRQSIKNLKPGKLIRDWQNEAEQLIEKELVDLGLLSVRQIKKKSNETPAFKKYFMHGVGHPIGLDVHDVGIITEPIQAGWVMTCEPAIYIREEGFGIRLEDTVLVTENGAVNLMESIPIEADEIEELMQRK